MKQKTVSRKSKKPRSFNPKTIAIELSEELKLDLDSEQQLQSENPAASYYRNAQIDKFLSKFTFDSDPLILQKEAFAKFLQTNAHMGVVNQHFKMLPNNPIAIPVDHPDVEITLRRAKALAHFVLTPMSEDEWFYGCKSSAGSSIGVPYANTAPEKKYSYPISVSDSKKLAPLWDRYCAFDPEFAMAVSHLNLSTKIGDRFKQTEESRATTVDKNTTSRRMIAVEPVVNMFFQQGLMDALIRRLEAIGIDITKVPDEHKRTAWESSITASKDTIDFSSASDCVSVEFLRWLLPPVWFSRLMLVRSPKMKIDGDVVELNMISTMGNATTFPIETLVFWCIAISSAMTVAEPTSRSLLPNWKYFGSCSVFGDDCITPSACTELFMQSTRAVGFIVNHEKSFFNGGYFRESCGGDYYRGYNVRPLYLKAPTSDKISALEPWLYAFFNGIQKKYISYFGPTNYVYEKRLFRKIFSIFNQYGLMVKVVPDWFPDDSGLKIGQELFRFQRAYSFSLSKLALSDQGTWRFNYCRYVYRHKEDWHEWLRYALYSKRKLSPLSSLIRLDDDDIYYCDRQENVTTRLHDALPYSSRGLISKVFHISRIRKLGGYVVATAHTPSWNVVMDGQRS